MHGGVNGLTEAMLRAVPVVVIPIFADQFRNGRLVENRGVGKVILKQDLAEDTIRAAVMEIVSDESYKKNAVRMSKLMREKPFSAEQRLIQWTTFAVDNGVLDVLHVQGSRMNFIVYFNLDVIAAFVAVLCLLIVIVLRLCCLLRRIFSVKKLKQQ
ncbi:hypothetical protein Y032_0306g2004 [Ancylostoma ceylanicum]|nr:hypothetical protein Y032_0306g2004 [Ancylostoma ceylanicum]